MNLVDLITSFGTDDRCRQALEHIRWPQGVQCLRCGTEARKIGGRFQYRCTLKGCEYHFSVTAETIFHDTHLSLWKWFLAVYLMCESKKGMSANQIKRTLSVSYQTAWYLCHRIRKAMSLSEDETKQLGTNRGTVEADETWVGGKRRHVGSGNLDNKTMVLGALERGETSRVRFRVERLRKKADRKTLHDFITKETAPDAAKIYTDENPAYLGIADADTEHHSVNHRAEEWVRGDVHTNGIEGVWSLFKRSIIGSYHQISVKHMDSYLNELEWRFNERDNPFLFRDTLKRLLETERVEYKELIERGA